MDCIVSRPDALRETTIGVKPGSETPPSAFSGMKPSRLIPETSRDGAMPACRTLAAAAASLPPGNAFPGGSFGTPAAAVFASCRACTALSFVYKSLKQIMPCSLIMESKLSDFARTYRLEHKSTAGSVIHRHSSNNNYGFLGLNTESKYYFLERTDPALLTGAKKQANRTTFEGASWPVFLYTSLSHCRRSQLVWLGCHHCERAIGCNCRTKSS